MGQDIADKPDLLGGELQGRLLGENRLGNGRNPDLGDQPSIAGDKAAVPRGVRFLVGWGGCLEWIRRDRQGTDLGFEGGKEPGKVITIGFLPAARIPAGADGQPAFQG